MLWRPTNTYQYNTKVQPCFTSPVVGLWASATFWMGGIIFSTMQTHCMGISGLPQCHDHSACVWSMPEHSMWCRFLWCQCCLPQVYHKYYNTAPIEIWGCGEHHHSWELWVLSNFTKELSLIWCLCQILQILRPNHWGEFISTFGFLGTEQAHK